jgi:DNA-binding SARP family transcriptional activator/TolB-like protein
MPLRLTTLGTPRVFYRDGVELAELPSQRLRFALLVYLAAEGEATRDSILSMFWPDRDPARSRHALRQMLYELRQLLGEDWIELGRDRVVVHADVDVVAFEAAATGGRHEEALALYGGEFLAGFDLDNRAFEGWVDRRRAQLGRLHRRLRRERIDALVRAGDVAGALAAAQAWVELDALEDEANHGLIRCLALAGERGEALARYESYERRLAAELQLEPLDETRALVARIREGDFAAADLPAAAGGVRAGAGPESGPVEGTEPGVIRSSGPGRGSVAAAGEYAGEAGGSGGVTRGRKRLTASWYMPALAAAVVVLVLAGVLGARDRRPEIPNGTPTARLVVLPFANRSGDSSLVSLAGALTESLARNLARSQPLDVVPPASVALLRERGIAADSVGRLFHADYLVTGSITPAAEGVRVAVELLDGRTGSLLRSEVVERPGGESRILVEDVVAGSAVLLRREIGRHVDVRRVRASTASEEAWRNVLEARSLQELTSRYLIYRDWDALDNVFSTADSLLARAAELDRRWAEPLVMRGWLMERRAVALGLRPAADTAARRKLYDAARGLADRATERDPEHAGAYELRGAVLHQLALLPGVPWDTAGDRLAAAEEQLRRATMLDPKNASAFRRRAEALSQTARFAAAKTAAQRAYGIDPFGSQAGTVVALLAQTSLDLGEDDEAERWCMEGRKSFGRQGPFVHCLFALHAWGEPSRRDMALLVQELASYRSTRAMLQPHLVHHLEVMLAAAYHRAGQPDSARAVFARIPVDSSDRTLLWLRSAAMYTMGDEPSALKTLAAYLAANPPANYQVVRSRAFWPLRQTPEFRRLTGL